MDFTTYGPTMNNYDHAICNNIIYWILLYLQLSILFCIEVDQLVQYTQDDLMSWNWFQQKFEFIISWCHF